MLLLLEQKYTANTVRWKTQDALPSVLIHQAIFYFLFFIYFILFATLITKNIGKEEEEKKKEVARRPNRNYGSL